MRARTVLAAISVVAFAAAARSADYAPGFGPNPALPEPEYSLIPTVNIAPASSWEDGAAPYTAGGPDSPSSSRAVAPRRPSMVTSAAALRRMLTLSDAMFGMARRSAYSRRIFASFASR